MGFYPHKYNFMSIVKCSALHLIHQCLFFDGSVAVRTNDQVPINPQFLFFRFSHMPLCRPSAEFPSASYMMDFLPFLFRHLNAGSRNWNADLFLPVQNIWSDFPDRCGAIHGFFPCDGLIKATVFCTFLNKHLRILLMRRCFSLWNKPFLKKHITRTTLSEMQKSDFPFFWF